MDNNNLQQFNPILDPELQAMMSIIQEKPMLRNMIDNSDFDSAYDVYNYYKNLEPTATQPFTQNNLLQRERQPELPVAAPNSVVHQHDSSSNPPQENPNQTNDPFQAWIEYAQILDPTVQSIPSLGNNSEPQRTNQSTSNHQPPIIISFETPVIPHNASASTSNSSNKGKATNSLAVQGMDLTTSRPEIGEPYMELKINGITIDTPKIPIPVCSCTGNPRNCYRYCIRGWQSACCTTRISKYPISNGIKRRGRIMNKEKFKSVLEEVLSNGHNIFAPIDLKTHWIKYRPYKRRSTS